MDLTEGTLLGGRVAYRQPRDGFRTGIEPVLLAASVPAQPGQRVLEGGTGAGAGLLCLLSRVPGVRAVGIERDTALAGIARANLALNQATGATVDAADLLVPDQHPCFDHAMANPPWHGPDSTASPHARRDAAKRATRSLLAAWAIALARRVVAGGTLTMVLLASSIPEALAALSDAGCGGPEILPLWPRAGETAKLVLLRATRCGHGPCRILPGLTLHDSCGYTAEARAVLWQGAALPWPA